VLVTNDDVNMTLDVIFADEILLTKREFVLKMDCIVEFPAAIAVERDEIPRAKIEYSVEFVEPIDVLIVEKYDK
jgi:hypothetical protein